ncbi:MAG: T9SS-dependent M36 family metallopeptidase [Saprospiraceae bacterium]|nr:T9SS-dependent M36 family metallopeptidase [Saprospiraceae bacterium]
MKRYFNLLMIILLWNFTLFAQSPKETIQEFLNKNYLEQGLAKTDITNWKITNQSTSKQSGVNYVYIQQQIHDIDISNGIANFAIKDGKIYSMGNRLVNNLEQKANFSSPSINPLEAIELAVKHLNIESPINLKINEVINTKEYICNDGGISKENIPVKLMYFSTADEKLRLIWDLSIYTIDAQHWWSVKIDAQNGELLDKNDWVVHCNFDHSPFKKCTHHRHIPTKTKHFIKEEIVLAPDQYTVFALPIESPSHGAISTVTNPADSVASPYGWHDTNGSTGAEYTITRGNNVYAYEDIGDNDSPGFSPDGGATLEFNFPYNPANAPSAYQSTAITNLFYMNNMMHDIWYHYGFDEASGNFQVNNYGNGGVDDDYVLAEAQDGGGTNNANFATPTDGNNPRMQMYLWSSGGSSGGSYLDVNSPSGIAGSYSATDATYGPGLPSSPITADVVLIEDDVTPINDGCDNITNNSQLSGKIVMIDRGNCTFVAKVESAQNEGALAVIIVNNVATGPIQMGGTSNNINIPSIMISQNDGNTIKAQMANTTVNATISNGGAVSSTKDGDLDNGIIAHEYGHGISTRLTGGASNSNCLSNAEQMGEGWSDWFGLMLTIEPGDQGSDIRGIGTYATNQATNGPGIRPAPYSTNFAVNPYTYGESNNTGQISQPHGVGFIFATVLWDLNWALIANYGGTADPDFIYGTGGNNIAMQLVIEGLKLQPCSPGMIDGRDAILQADQLLYNGVHQCLIWNVFANRGFGYSASQGSASSRSDQTEAFDLPPICQAPTIPPTAAFAPSSLTSCITTISFSDSSFNIPQSWFWDFGDGNTDTIQNPTHIYTSSGTFTVKLVVSNSIGSDSTTQQVTITLPPAPVISDVEVCAGDTAFVIASVSGTAQWRNSGNNIIHNGDTLIVPNVTTTETYYVENIVGNPSQYIGPANSSIGGGSYHASGYHGALNFTALQSFEIVSAWVDADGAGPRTLTLASGVNNNGNPPGQGIAQVTLNLVDGPQRVNLNLTVPSAGDYNIGGNNVDLYRNNSGANYPYTLPGYMTINNSSATTSPTGYYYYLYDIEVREPQCISIQDTVSVMPVTSNFSYVDNGGSVTFTDASNGATSWLWNFGDNNTSTLQNPVHTYTNPGTYTITLTINNGACSSTQTFSIILGLPSIGNSNPNLSIVPNPTSGFTKVILDKAIEENLLITISDLTGKIIESSRLIKGKTVSELDLSDLPSAVYLIQIKGNTFSETRKLILN